MLTPVRCMSCRSPIGDVAPIFRRIRFARVEKLLKAMGVIATQAAADASLQIDMSDVFEMLDISMDCCRRSLATAMDMRDYY